MGRIDMYVWRCDGCDEEKKDADEYVPANWDRFQLRPERGICSDFWFTICGSCCNELLQNARKGPTWFQRLRRAVGGKCL